MARTKGVPPPNMCICILKPRRISTPPRRTGGGGDCPPPLTPFHCPPPLTPDTPLSPPQLTSWRIAACRPLLEAARRALRGAPHSPSPSPFRKQDHRGGSDMCDHLKCFRWSPDTKPGPVPAATVLAFLPKRAPLSFSSQSPPAEQPSRFPPPSIHPPATPMAETPPTPRGALPPPLYRSPSHTNRPPSGPRCPFLCSLSPPFASPTGDLSPRFPCTRE